MSRKKQIRPPSSISIKDIAEKAIENEKQKIADLEIERKRAATADSFVNFSQKLGVGADNAMTSSGYGFNPISRVRTTLEWIHRGSWLGGVAVDTVANDMTRGGCSILGDIKPEDMEKIEECATTLQIWDKLNENTKWARLYGGSIAVMMIDGQDMSTPLRLETIGKGQFKGLLILDRWMVEPSLEDLVTEAGPDIGMPKFYKITADAPALPRLKVHFSRCLRQEGIRLPYWQRLQENMWGISIIERLYDRMIAFDSATTGAAQLVYKAYLRTYKVKGLRDIISNGGPAVNGLVSYVDMMRKFQGIEGITLLDGEDEFEAMQHSAFGGLSDALTQFAQQLSGALQIPLVRLFGQSPSGFSTGDTDLRMYYDSINQQQVSNFLVPVTRIYRAIAQSEGIKLPDGFKIEFTPLWQLEEGEKATIAVQTIDAVAKAQEAGLISDKVAGEELRQSGKVTGIFLNISQDDIDNLDEVPGPPDVLELGKDLPGGEASGTSPRNAPITQTGASDPAKEVNNTSKPSKPKDRVRDTGMQSVSVMKKVHDLDVVIENPKGSLRSGDDWEISMPADYGYIMRTTGTDGDQVDCYIGPRPMNDNVHVINQIDLDTGKFDEHKAMLGFGSKEDAVNTYLDGYSDGRGWDRLWSITTMNMGEFKNWIVSGDHTQPLVMGT